MADSRESVESRDIDARRVLAVAGALVLAILVAVAGCRELLLAWQAWDGAAPNAPRTAAADPRHAAESAPQIDRRAYDAEKRRLIGEWQWIDRQAGIARIPVDAAMDALAAR
ncbi:MAG TPA: hypothetical protein VF801_11525, partial [Rhodocyclaceae bacterium]